VIFFEIPDIPKTPNQLLRRHWSAVMKEKQKWHLLVSLCCKYKGEPLQKAKITFTRHSSRKPDYDNLVASFKWIADGLIKAGVIVDDKYEVIGQSQYKWEKAAPKSSKVTVQIEF
jgi:Holliday junction resolvase RusA-like endonuclease